MRFDTMLFHGYEVPPFYDPLLGKLIVHASTREEAIDRMSEAHARLSIGGLKTTIPLHAALAHSPDLRDGAVHTRWLEDWLERTPLKPAEEAA